MQRTSTRRVLGIGATLLAAGLMLSACSSSPSNTTSTGSQITLTIGTFNNFGYDKSSPTMQGADLYTKYMNEHPNIKINATVAATSDDARAAFNTAIGTGTGAYDIQAVDVDWMPSIMAQPDKFVDLKSALAANDYQPWKTGMATTPDGKVLGGGTDIGPEGICYRADLLQAANIPSDRASVAAWLGGANATWDSFFAAGKEYVAKSGGKAFFDSSAAVYQGMVNQVQYSYIDKDNNIIDPATNTQIRALYDQVTTAAITDKESAGLQQWTDSWNAAFKATDNTSFAVSLCPAWIINNIKNNAGADFKGWDIADVFPGIKAGQGGNWGGSYLVVPTQGKNIEAAKALVAWLTAPAQQAAVFAAASNYPSSPTAAKDPAVAGKTDPFLNNAPVGTIFANRAAAVSVVPYKGSKYFDIQSKMADALNRVDVDKSMSPADSWTQWTSDVKALS
ncbi:MAG: extracellular solute-binding protein [Actinomycetia bacterium]|nr:extracellular solute-binding protein [Actinomycetes bacterium]